jgi:deoxyribodipyrimidine photo-lyase
LTGFPVDDGAWRARLDALDPSVYARTRNHLDGSVSRLSPYFTHGFLSLREAVDQIRQRTRLTSDDKLFAEFGWRSFFHHVWQWAGDDILEDLRPGLQGVTYQDDMPLDVRQARTGLPVIDQAVRTLYTEGYLHNHARMWLASYLVHLRHVHWRAGADWLYGHLLDGDLASNHLSWQWVVSTFSVKPYLFNADNVRKFSSPVWHSDGTPLDTSYEALERMARGLDESGREIFELMPKILEARLTGTEEPALLARPPLDEESPVLSKPEDLVRWVSSKSLPGSQPAMIELVHPWGLRSASLFERQMQGQNLYRLGVIHVPGHADLPWSTARWQFVLERMKSICAAIYVGDLADVGESLSSKARLFCDESLGCAKTRHALDQMDLTWSRPSGWLTQPSKPCWSFSSYSRAVREVK